MRRFIILFFTWLFFTGIVGFAQETDVFTDGRDGKVYHMVKIGNQIWMAENLAYLPRVDNLTDLSWDSSRYWVYGYQGLDVGEAKTMGNYKTYGVLYNWTAAMESACPSGWRIPEESDWQELESFLGMDEDQVNSRNWRKSGAAGNQLKSVSGWYDNSGTNEWGFNVLPGGVFGYNDFECMKFCGYFWVGTATHRDNAWVRSFLFDSDGIQRIEERKWFGCSVRCIKVRQ